MKGQSAFEAVDDGDGARDSRFEAEAKYLSLVEQIPAVVYLDPVDEGLDSIFVSPQVFALLGIYPEEWIADPRSWSRHIHPEDSDRAWDDHTQARARGVPVDHEYRMVHEDGTVKWVQELATVIDDEHGDPWLVQGLIFDITARRAWEELQEAQRERLSVIIETQLEIATTDLDVDEVMRTICVRTQDLTHAEGATILIVEGDGLLVRVATGSLVHQVGMRIPIQGTLPGWVQQHQRSAIVGDAQKDPRAGEMAKQLGIRSMVAVQLLHRGESIGQLVVVAEASDSFTQDDADTLERLSAALSSAIIHATEFESERQHVDALARFETIYEGAAIGIALVAPDGDFLDANPAFVRMFGYTMEELKSRLPDGSRPADLATTDEPFRRMMAGESDTYEQERRFFRKDGLLVWGRVAAALQRDAEGRPHFAITMIENITERKEAEEKLAYLAYHDEPTGLANRSRFMEVLEVSIARARRLSLAVGVIDMDLDNFKLVNDSLGHVAGDQLLKQLSDRLRRISQDAGLVARQSGDEFLLLLPDLAIGPGTEGIERALVVVEEHARSVHELFREPFTLEGVDFTISASLGIGLFPRDAIDAKSLLSHADAAMYRSKGNGPGGTVVYSADHEDPMRRLRLATQLRRAVEQQSWELHYQPIVDLDDGHIRGVEALVRGRAENGELIPPNDFIPLAEEIGLIEDIGRWVIGEMCRQMQEWSAAGLEVEVAFNVSPRQLWSARFPQEVLRALEVAGVDPHQVVIEITESTAMTDQERTREILQELHDAGFQIAIDDFGTGYSSLSRLKHLPIDILKIDRSFVSDAHLDRDAGTMVQAMVQLARNLGMQPLAEGVETTEELAFLRALDCPVAQGFLFSRPVPAAKITELLLDGSPLIPGPAGPSR